MNSPNHPDPAPPPETTGVLSMLLMMAGIPLAALVLLGALRWVLGYFGI